MIYMYLNCLPGQWKKKSMNKGSSKTSVLNCVCQGLQSVVWGELPRSVTIPSQSVPGRPYHTAIPSRVQPDQWSFNYQFDAIITGRKAELCSGLGRCQFQQELHTAAPVPGHHCAEGPQMMSPAQDGSSSIVHCFT